jgi:signal transduction histidine kinase
MGGPLGPSSRSTLIAGLLVVILATTGLLAWQAQYAVTSHRAAAEEVLRDYAALAADELVRRSTARIGYGGYYPLVTALGERLETDEDLEEAVRGIEREADEELRPALSLAKRFFVAGRDEIPAWLRAEIEASREKSGPYVVAHATVEGKPVTGVFRTGARTAGFEVNLEALETFVRRAAAERPLLPPSLGRGRVTNDAIFVAVFDHGGVERYRSMGTYRPEFGVEVPFGDEYGGVLEGWRALVSVDPGRASDLVIGGLPPSRLPVFLGLLLLTAGIVATVVLELRRERLLQRLRADFVASVSHELRTPLTQIRMFAETLLLGRVRSDGEGRRSLEIIHREARRLGHLVDNVLQFSRAEPSVSHGLEAHELESRVREALEIFQPLIAGTGVRIVTRFESGVDAAIDPDAFRQVLLNLFDNAVKYGPRSQDVLVGIESKNGRARVFVEDQGPGIPLRERERVFERFHRLERERTSSVAGTGIGLAVVRELVSRQGGRAFVESGESGGTRVVVELPLAPS